MSDHTFAALPHFFLAKFFDIIHLYNLYMSENLVVLGYIYISIYHSDAHKSEIIAQFDRRDAKKTLFPERSITVYFVFTFQKKKI